MLGLFRSKRKSAPPKILVVDDEPDYVSTIQCRLEWCRYEVITAANGEEGLAKARAERPDLILLDTSMPVMNGHKMLDRMRRDPALKDIPVIMVTALCEPQDIAEASSYGVADYVAKPFNFTEVLEKISGVLGGKAVKGVQ
ncbi:MAG TPA: response regulator [Sedimentisphaerales bacterium]|nr:response regulator [Sedimentisphaerales bacterium]